MSALSLAFFSGMTECVQDKQGRVNIPIVLLQYGLIDKGCAVIGVSSIEIWSRAMWKEYVAHSSDILMKLQKR
ncbi:division/cell wall cluster transcriptional repressor MraZ [Aneurinibacillus thermoaerophilus]|uniref:division/cell wall cluster transcriptional repressor MraZ n=1 Tax=Aneurinibacillus thermoaerophilus TaxID=143495 RepID=UPI000709F356|nr:division/cell wall cluster transcriptional repressor MraZ [Aneurinibacillus thermoaerophilus]AMA72564.1 hypothetical protein ACH33_06680 [Aneurinibacillus sp. XH2]MED0674731.1 division/cell wall cluster transcriptional repressor MraZ [Aneurinibacillus thermoaerophilus]MED0680214.1 division/cell wall cluster transcriptional repressor MraZ [Aneurinibacillus thermoaerophilus]MED0756678.1 division/cell wall cluster transcriptional repressor MraZ [Aneurinibacillus thermoaerophilus]MED0760728.1 d